MKFSIIIPVYNVQDYLEECVDSVLAQSYPDYEIVLVDDGSTDRSAQICDQYQSRYSFIKVVHQENRGLSSARNTGAANAGGEYLLFLDSDDFYLDPAVLEVIYNGTQANPDVVVFDLVEYDEKTQTAKRMGITDHKKAFYESGLEYLNDALSQRPDYRWYICVYAIRRKFWQEQDICFPLGFKYEDLGTTYRVLLNAERVSVEKKDVYGYRRDRDGAITRQTDYKSLLDKTVLSASAAKDIFRMASVPPALKTQLMKNYAMSFSDVLIRSSQLSEGDRKRLIAAIKREKWLLRYWPSMGLKYKLLYYLIQIVGMNETARLLGVRRFLKYG